MTDRWRYVCPECGSVRIQKRRTYGKVPIGGIKPEKRYQCNGCNNKTNVRVDKKTGELVE